MTPGEPTAIIMYNLSEFSSFSDVIKAYLTSCIHSKCVYIEIENNIYTIEMPNNKENNL